MASKKCEGVLARYTADRLRELDRGEGARGDDDLAPGCVRQRRHSLATDLDQRLRLERRLDGIGKAVTIYGERAPCRQLVGIARTQDQGAAAPHLLVQQPDRVVEPVVGAERIGADQLGERAGLVRFGFAHRAHLMQDHRDARAGELPGRLAAGQAATDHLHRSGHGSIQRTDRSSSDMGPATIIRECREGA